jgi:predicted nucleotidyltransferase
MCSDHKLKVQWAALFGSIVREQPMTDVDLIVQFRPRTNPQIARLVRKIKGRVASDFHNTFDLPLHVTFFCSNEQEAKTAFIEKAGRHEIIIGG